jgi:uncharacterized membrane protein
MVCVILIALIFNSKTMDQNQTPPQQPSQQSPQQSTNPKDIADNKVLAIIGYLGILCLLPLLLAKDSAYAKFHGKQALVLLIAWIVVCAVGVVPILGWLVAFVGYILGFVLMIVGMVNAYKGEMKELPWIGQYSKHLNF